MKRLLTTLILLVFGINSLHAEHVWQNNLSIVNDKSYILESKEKNKLSLTQYSFPELQVLKTLEIEGKLYSTGIQVFDNSILITTYNYVEALPVEEISESEESQSEQRARFSLKFSSEEFSIADDNIYTEKIKYETYDLDFNKISELITEIKYTYYWTDEANVSVDSSDSTGISKVSDGLCQDSKKKKKKKKKQDCVKAEL